MKATQAVILMVVGFAFFSCAEKERAVQPTIKESEIALHVATWKLVSFESSNGTITPIPTSESFKIFFAAGTRFNGSTAVNTFDGPYVSDSRQKTIHVENIGSTRADGGPIERQFYDALRTAVRYRATSDGMSKKLRIYYGTNLDILNFVAEQ